MSISSLHRQSSSHWQSVIEIRLWSCCVENKRKMISSKLFLGISEQMVSNYRRNIVTIAPLCSKTSDPIQKLFLDKIQEYKNKSRDGKLVDSNPNIEREMKTELERVAKQYGGGSGVDMTQFPGFKFEDPQVDPISN